MDGYSYVSGNPYNKLKYSGKELDQEQGQYKYHFGWSKHSGDPDLSGRDYYPELGRWVVVDPARQFASGYVFNGNTAVNGYDEDGRFFAELYMLYKIYTIASATYNVVTAFNKGGLAGGIQALAGSAVSFAVGTTVSGIAASFGDFSGLLPGAGMGALTGGISGGITSSIMGGSFSDGFGAGALGGTIGGGLSGLASAEALPNRYERASDIGAESNNDKIKDKDFIKKGLKAMKEKGGELGVEMHDKIVDSGMPIIVDNTIDGYGYQGNTYESTWERYLGINGKPSIFINGNRIFDESLFASDWKHSGISTNNYVAKTAATLYHEAGHHFGMSGWVYNNVTKQTYLKFYEPSAVSHIGPHTPFTDPMNPHSASQLTMSWFRRIRW